MKPIRLAGVVAAAILLAAPQVGAECAWVLWEELYRVDFEGSPSSPARSPSEWGIIGTAQNPQDCSNFASAAVKDRADRWHIPSPPGVTPKANQGPTVKAEGIQVTVIMRDAALNYRYLCLPDTIDPRGPKAR